MKNLFKCLALGAVVAASTTFAHATSIVATDSISFNSVSVTPPGPLFPIASVTSINFGANGNTSAQGTGNLSGAPAQTVVTLGSSLFPNGVNGGTGGTPFSFTIVGFGTFTETANPVVNTNGTPNGGVSNVDLYLLGTFTPSFGGYTSGPASFDVALTETVGTNGTSFSGSGTFASPPTPITVTPEPSSLILLGTGLAGAAGTLFRRRRIKA